MLRLIFHGSGSSSSIAMCMGYQLALCLLRPSNDTAPLDHAAPASCCAAVQLVSLWANGLGALLTLLAEKLK